MSTHNTPKPNQQICPERIQASRWMPALRFKEFTDEWQEKKLGDEVRTFDGTHQTPDYVKCGVPFYSVEHITSDNFKKTRYISESVYDQECRRVKIENDDILMTRIGDIGTSKYISWSPKASFYVSLALIKRVGLINMKFLDQYIKSDLIQHELWRRTIHVAFPKKINLCEIGECRITTPKEKEQQKIADFLTTVDEKIEKLEAKKKAFEKYKKGVMQAIFNQKIRFKKPDGSNYPDWEEKKLGDLFHEQTERKADKKFELLSVTTNNGITKQTSSNKRDNSSADTSNYKVVNVGDIVYNTMRMWQGASGISDFNGYVSPAYTVIRLVDGSANFFQYLFKQPRVIFNFFRYSQGLTSDTWNLKFHHFSTVEVTIPTNTTEQEKIAEFLTALDNKINLINNQLEQAKLFKKSLLQRMFV